MIVIRILDPDGYPGVSPQMIPPLKLCPGRFWDRPRIYPSLSEYTPPPPLQQMYICNPLIIYPSLTE